MVRRIEQRIDFSDRDLAGSIRDLLNVVSGTNFALGDDTAVEAWLAMRDEQRRHLRIVHSNSEAIAGDARLSDFKDRSADAVPVPDANFIVGETFNGEVLSKLSVLE